MLTGEGLDHLKGLLGRLLDGGSQKETIVLTTARQHRIISQTISHVSKAKTLLEARGELELAALEMRWARDKMAAMLGRSATEEMLTMLFSEFCIGK